jgi:circadian clock protein KaiC
MSEQRVTINTISTGVPGLDRVLGGGLPEYSFNLIAGAPGTGKTTLAQQIMFANASAERPVLHFTVLGEPPLKMLRYQQQFEFFDPGKVERVIRYRNLSEEVLSGDLDRVLEGIVREVEESSPELVVIDSFRTVMRSSSGGGSEASAQAFLQRLSLHLASWEATSFLIGEYTEAEIRDNPVFTVADGILWLFQQAERNSTMRKLQAVKVRGQAPMPGLHTFRITPGGLRVFPRTVVELEVETSERGGRRLSTGVEGLDAMLSGGIPAGDSVLLAGPSGSGKTSVGTHFVEAGIRAGERAVIAVFEENPGAYVARAASLGLDLAGMVERGELRIIYLRPLDLSADEALQEIQDAVEALDASRVVIDSLSGFEIALAQSFRDEFRESLYRMVAALTRVGITVLMTVEVTDDYTSLRFSPHAISFLTDDIILQRYVELDGELRRVLAVVKMRGSPHGKEWRAYEISDKGVRVGEALREYRGIVTGVPVPTEDGLRRYAGLTDVEVELLRALEHLREATAAAVAAEVERAPDEVQPALDRLVALDRVLREEDEGEGAAVYRMAARSLKA